MNRTGLVIALAVALITGIVFAIWPQIDLNVAAYFYDVEHNLFNVNAQPWVLFSRDAARVIITALVAPAILAVLGKLIFPRRRMLIDGRAALFLTVTLALGPGILTNTILKDHWGRSRPIDVKNLGGTDRFVPWWDPRGECPDNCSFVAGEPSGAFWTLAPASLAPPQWRLLAYGAALGFGAAVGTLRVAAGAHFLSDAIFASVFAFLVIWTCHGLIFRWRRTRLNPGTVEGLLAKPGLAIQSAFWAILRRIRGNARAHS
jgi:membrane-associated PAP2 superfamily phosphatase